MKKWIRFFVAFIVVVTGLFQFYDNNRLDDGRIIEINEKKDVSLNDFLSAYHSGDFQKVVVEDDNNLKWYNSLGLVKKTSFMSTRTELEKEVFDVYETSKPSSSSLTELGILMTWAVDVEVIYTEVSMLQKILELVGPIFLFLIVLLVMAKFMMPKWWGLPFNMKVGKQTNKAQVNTKFDDIAGMEEVKMELMEIVDYLKNPEKYKKVGARHPKWVLLYGLPWAGKTLLARAVAGESNVPFFSASGSEFMEMLVGMWAAKVRELFNKAKSAWTAIVFIDEIDAIGKKRWAGHTGWHQEQEQTLNQILTEMDWFDKTANIVVIAATNRPDILDSALLRAGRFDRKISVWRPTYEERILIFKYYFKDKKIDSKVNVETLAKRTTWLVWADIETIVNEAALNVAKWGRSVLLANDFEYALEKVLMGPEKKIKSIKEHEKNLIAYHELWHAVTAHLLKQTDSVEKISIVSRGQSLGATWMLPDEDRYLYSKAKFLDEIVSLLGWRAAEEIFFGKDEITTWASNDFEKATSIVKDMIVKYGMDDDLWPVLYFDKDKEDYPIYKPYSEKTAELIDEKIKLYLFDWYQHAKKIIKDNSSLIEKMFKVLLEKEYLNKEEFDTMMKDPTTIDTYLKEAIQYKKELAEQVKKEAIDKEKKSKVEKNIDKNKKIDVNDQKKKLKDMLDKFLK